MSGLIEGWLEDPEDDEEPDFSQISSDPIGVMSEQFDTMVDRFQKEGYTRCEILAALNLSAADLAWLMAGGPD